MSELIEELGTVQYLLNATGQKTGVLLSIELWERLLTWLENKEDEAIALQTFQQFQEGDRDLQKLGWQDWQDIRDDWDEAE